MISEMTMGVRRLHGPGVSTRADSALEDWPAADHSPEAWPTKTRTALIKSTKPRWPGIPGIEHRGREYGQSLGSPASRWQTCSRQDAGAPRVTFMRQYSFVIHPIVSHFNARSQLLSPERGIPGVIESGWNGDRKVARLAGWKACATRSGRVPGIAPRHPPTPPDVRFSASGG